MNTYTATIPLQPPFDFGLMLEFLEGFSPAKGEQRIADGTLEKSWLAGGKPVRVTMRQREANLECTLTSPERLDRRTRERVVDRASAFVSASEDLGELYAIAERDPAFAPVAKRLRGLHHPKLPSPFEAACWAVIHQRARLAQSRARKAALVKRFGVPGFDAFPEAITLAGASEAELEELLGNTRRAKAVGAVAHAFAGVDERWLEEGPIAEVEAWLREIYGIGDFSAGFILYRGLGRAIGLPWSDHFVEAAAQTYPGCTRKDLEAKSETYGRWRGHWALYLWAATFVGNHQRRPQVGASLVG